MAKYLDRLCFFAAVTCRVFIAAGLLAAFVLLPAGCGNSLPVLGQTPVADPLVVEEHSQALAYWAQRGIRDAVVMNFDAHDDFRRIPDAKIDALRDIYRRGDWQRFSGADTTADRGLYNIGNWIYAGARLGMFREIYWVIPFRHFSGENAGAALRGFLKSYSFSDEDIQTFTLRDNRFSGRFQGIPVTICGLESLPVIRGPLLLSIDTDFLPSYSTAYRASYLTSLYAMFDGLYRMKYRIRDAVVCYSVNGDFLSPRLRWLGDTIAMILKKPGLIYEPLPELLDIQQKTDNAYREADPGGMLSLTRGFLDRQPDPSLLVYRAYAYMMQGDAEKAYTAAFEGCRADKRYCTAMPDLGAVFCSKGQALKGEKFFRAGFSADPKMRNGLFAYACCLRSMGRFSEAIAYFEKDEALNGTFPTHFLLVETYLMAGDRKAAAEALKVAAEDLDTSGYDEVISQVVADAVYASIDFSERLGLREISARLRQNPSVKKMLMDFPVRSGSANARRG